MGCAREATVVLWGHGNIRREGGREARAGRAGRQRQVPRRGGREVVKHAGKGRGCRKAHVRVFALLKVRHIRVCPCVVFSQ